MEIKATGPKTAEGKARSSMNAFKHGLTARTVVITEEERPFYNELAKEMFDEHHPATATERELVRTLTDGYWKLRRLRSIEDGLFAWGHEGDPGNFEAATPEIHSTFTDAATFEAKQKTFLNLSLYEQRTRRAIEKATKELKSLQLERQTRESEARAEALKIHQFNKMIAPHEPAAVLPLTVGHFVFSPHDFETELRLTNAKNAHFNHETYMKKAA